MSNIRKTDLYKNMTTYHACECAEGFGEGENASRDEQLAAWQFIYDKKMFRNLQGFYGRTIKFLIDTGLISTKES